MQKKFQAILTLIRFPNLLFIFLTQVLAWHYLVIPALPADAFILPYSLMLLINFSTVLIAAAGYIINDYFDMGIDTINKPHRVTIEKLFSRRRIIIWHILLNVLAIIMASYVYILHLKWRFIAVQLFSIFLLVIYSTTLKRKMLIGNISIAILTGLTIFNTGLYALDFDSWNWQSKSTLVFWLYIVFAMVITLIREIVKDMEDVKGDAAQNCNTLPLVWGINAAKYLVYFLSGLLCLIIVYSLSQKINPSVGLGILWICGVAAPLLFGMYRLYQAKTALQFHSISSLIKWITFIGILSMLMV